MGVGAGYRLTVKNLGFDYDRVSVKRNEYTAEIRIPVRPDRYEFKADHSYWGFENTALIEGGYVTAVLNSYDLEKLWKYNEDIKCRSNGNYEEKPYDEKVFSDDETIVELVVANMESDYMDIEQLFSPGWVWSEPGRKWNFKDENGINAHECENPVNLLSAEIDSEEMAEKISFMQENWDNPEFESWELDENLENITSRYEAKERLNLARRKMREEKPKLIAKINGGVGGGSRSVKLWRAKNLDRDKMGFIVQYYPGRHEKDSGTAEYYRNHPCLCKDGKEMWQNARYFLRIPYREVLEQYRAWCQEGKKGPKQEKKSAASEKTVPDSFYITAERQAPDGGIEQFTVSRNNSVTDSFDARMTFSTKKQAEDWIKSPAAKEWKDCTFKVHETIRTRDILKEGLDKVEELKIEYGESETVYFDPEKGTGALRETLLSIVESGDSDGYFPRVYPKYRGEDDYGFPIAEDEIISLIASRKEDLGRLPAGTSIKYRQLFDAGNEVKAVWQSRTKDGKQLYGAMVKYDRPADSWEFFRDATPKKLRESITLEHEKAARLLLQGKHRTRADRYNDDGWER